MLDLWEPVGNFLKIGGGFAALVLLGWRFVDEFGTFLRIAVNVDTDKNGHNSAKSAIENKGNRIKLLREAFLLIGPEGESPIDTANLIASSIGLKYKFHNTNNLYVLCQFHDLKNLENTYIKDRAFIPLRFFYHENIGIADETLTYRAPIKSDNFVDNSVYSVRFFVQPDRQLRFARRLPYHRSTHDSFLFKKAA